MSTTQDLISSLEKLLKLHKSLYEIAVKKTECIKVGDMDTLNRMLKDEQTLVKEIDKWENVRMQHVRNMLPNVDSPSVRDCIEYTTGEEKVQLEEKANLLTEVILELKERNSLNQQLVYQSLQFVNFSLNLLMPQPESINYDPPSTIKKQNLNSQGLFNTKA